MDENLLTLWNCTNGMKICYKFINLMKTHFDWYLSLWLQFVTVIKIFKTWWNIISVIWWNSQLWWKFVTERKIHQCADNSTEWWTDMRPMKIHNFDEGLWQLISITSTVKGVLIDPINFTKFGCILAILISSWIDWWVKH